jgi:hypothetical protein
MSEMSKELKNSDLYGKWSAESHQGFIPHLANEATKIQLTLAQLSKERVPRPEEIGPHPNDSVEINGVANPIWTFDAKNGQLAAGCLARWLLLDGKACDAHKANVDKERAVLVTFLKFMSVEMKRSLDNLPGTEAALGTHNLFAIWPFLLKAVSMSGPNTAMRVIGDMATLVQADEYGKYCSELRIYQAEFKDLLQHPDRDVWYDWSCAHLVTPWPTCAADREVYRGA